MVSLVPVITGPNPPEEDNFDVQKMTDERRFLQSSVAQGKSPPRGGFIRTFCSHFCHNKRKTLLGGVRSREIDLIIRPLGTPACIYAADAQATTTPY